MGNAQVRPPDQALAGLAAVIGRIPGIGDEPYGGTDTAPWDQALQRNSYKTITLLLPAQTTTCLTDLLLRPAAALQRKCEDQHRSAAGSDHGQLYSAPSASSDLL